MAKYKIKSEAHSFGGIFSIMEQFGSTLCICNRLDTRSKVARSVISTVKSSVPS